MNINYEGGKEGQASTKVCTGVRLDIHAVALVCISVSGVYVHTHTRTNVHVYCIVALIAEEYLKLIEPGQGPQEASRRIFLQLCAGGAAFSWRLCGGGTAAVTAV